MNPKLKQKHMKNEVLNIWIGSVGTFNELFLISGSKFESFFFFFEKVLTSIDVICDLRITGSDPVP